MNKYRNAAADQFDQSHQSVWRDQPPVSIVSFVQRVGLRDRDSGQLTAGGYFADRSNIPVNFCM